MLYCSILGREAQSVEIADMLKTMQYGVSRKYIFSLFVSSDEFVTKCNNIGIISGNVILTEARDQKVGITRFILRCYEKIIGRLPSVDELNIWCSQLINNNTTVPRRGTVPAPLARPFYKGATQRGGCSLFQSVSFAYRLWLTARFYSKGLLSCHAILHIKETLTMLLDDAPSPLNLLHQ